MVRWRRKIVGLAGVLLVMGPLWLHAQSVNHPTRLILKDGSYQVVTQYTVKDGVVRYRSAERNNALEELPASLVDWDATNAWEQAHTAGGAGNPVIDPELTAEEADIASRTPEVAPNLKLPDSGSVLALDTFNDGNELVSLSQSDSDLNKNTAHNILKATINPIASSHQLIQLKGTRAVVQLHTGTPAIYVRIGDDLPPEPPPDAVMVDTHGTDNNSVNAAVPAGGAATSQYVIVRADVRTDVRVIGSFKTTITGEVSRQEDVMETASETLSGGHWMKLTPKAPLLPGEYALMEVLSPKQVNLSVWDFGVHPDAPENDDVILPVEKKPLTLQHR
ncbi:MAG TPA: hypothetical protein VNU94_05975 [Acidobacteriaceae bacterium]|nr:hypothetical protein [Acidobacteriaceae bacterium]